MRACMQKDGRRGSYFLKEALLGKKMCLACGLADTSPDMDAVVNWRTNAKAKRVGDFVANLSEVRGPRGLGG